MAAMAVTSATKRSIGLYVIYMKVSSNSTNYSYTVAILRCRYGDRRQTDATRDGQYSDIFENITNRRAIGVIDSFRVHVISIVSYRTFS